MNEQGTAPIFQFAEMNAEQLAETTMNPEKRTLLQVRPEDAVEGRRKFIADNALDVKNLDV